MTTPTKGRRGYTKWGYPIVWKRSNTHEECMAKLKAQQDAFQAGDSGSGSVPPPVGAKVHSVGGVDFIL